MFGSMDIDLVILGGMALVLVNDLSLELGNTILDVKLLGISALKFSDFSDQEFPDINIFDSKFDSNALVLTLFDFDGGFELLESFIFSIQADPDYFIGHGINFTVAFCFGCKAQNGQLHGSDATSADIHGFFLGQMLLNTQRHCFGRHDVTRQGSSKFSITYFTICILEGR